MIIRTVLGDLEANCLDYCQCHEHLFILSRQSKLINPLLCIDSYDKTYEEVRDYHNNGGNWIVDAQPVGCGRDSKKLERLSQATGVHIIASTGFHKLIFYGKNHWIHNISKSGFAELMLSEINTGMYENSEVEFSSLQTTSRAGMIKTAIDEKGIDSRYEKLLSAAAEVSIKTGTPIQCHIENAETADELISYLKDCGVKANHIILAHMDRCIDHKQYAINALKQGVYLQCDTIARYKYHSNEAEAKWLGDLCELGYDKQILLGLDTTRARMKSYGGKVGLSFILLEFSDILKENGINEETIKQFVRYNPQNALSIKSEGE
ncbi:MAG: hypothetical protein CVU84_00885 [Firmicutes bacterium HGW-Firmicutes-1]|jgi:phosphotriesterase-related protein|nr:MAG: hypothetical protein CVU84_00885 [Firmicutes bacterium HGW-Firmicutes-1]